MILFSFSTNGQNGAQKNRGLLNKVTGTNQIDSVKAENVLPGASLINCGNHFFCSFFSNQMRLYRRCDPSCGSGKLILLEQLPKN